MTAADNVTATDPSPEQDSHRPPRSVARHAGRPHYLARNGGFDVKNNNDLSGGVRQILDDQSYYLVAYEPDADTFDPAKQKYNKLEVKVKRAGAKVRYRSGFFNVADKPVAKAPVEQTPTAQLQAALLSPFAVSGIGLHLNPVFGTDAKGGTFVRSILHINGADLKFVDDKNDLKKAVFDVLAMSFGDNGQPGDQIAKSYTLTVGPGRINRLRMVLSTIFLTREKPGPISIASRSGTSWAERSARQANLSRCRTSRRIN